MSFRAQSIKTNKYELEQQCKQMKMNELRILAQVVGIPNKRSKVDMCHDLLEAVNNVTTTTTTTTAEEDEFLQFVKVQEKITYNQSKMKHKLTLYFCEIVDHKNLKLWLWHRADLHGILRLCGTEKNQLQSAVGYLQSNKELKQKFQQTIVHSISMVAVFDMESHQLQGYNLTSGSYIGVDLWNGRKKYDDGYCTITQLCARGTFRGLLQVLLLFTFACMKKIYPDDRFMLLQIVKTNQIDSLLHQYMKTNLFENITPPKKKTAYGFSISINDKDTSLFLIHDMHTSNMNYRTKLNEAVLQLTTR